MTVPFGPWCVLDGRRKVVGIPWESEVERCQGAGRALE
jgi:hypothetical protein